jgi:hypothetical protein
MILSFLFIGVVSPFIYGGITIIFFIFFQKLIAIVFKKEFH